MAIITVVIDKLGAGALDGVTPLNLATPGIVENLVSNQTKRITVPNTVNLGLIDLGQLWYQTAPVQQGAPMLLVRATATSSGGAYGLGALYFRRSPENLPAVNTNQVNFQTLAATGGQYLGTPRLFPAGHLFGVNSGGVAGPHKLVLVLKTFADADVLSAA